MHGNSSLKTCFVLAFMSLATAAPASELPRFDGVYVQTGDGAFHQLNRVQFGRSAICSGGFPRTEMLSYLHIPRQQDLSAAPEVERGEIESIFIRSRTERLEFTSDAVEFGSFLSVLPRSGNLTITPVMWGGLAPHCITQADPIDWEDSSIVSSNCGFRVDSFDILNETETTYQYFDNDGTTLNPSGAAGVTRCGQPRDETIETRGIFIRTNEGQYFAAFSNR